MFACLLPYLLPNFLPSFLTYLKLIEDPASIGLTADEYFRKLEEEENESKDPLKLSIETLVHEVRIITSLVMDTNRQDKIEEEWQTLAKVFDRFFLLMFFVMFFLSSSALLLPVAYVINPYHSPHENETYA